VSIFSLRIRLGCCLVASVAPGVEAVSAQPAVVPGPRPLMGHTAQAPTEGNGYDELVAAGVALRTSKRFAAAQSADATLGAKREALADRPVIRALALLRRGLARPVSLPRDAAPITDRFPQMADFRSLARLLAMQQYVMFADGRVADAIGSARLGMGLARAVQTDALITGLVGLAISSLTLRTLGDHLDQMSARDCELLYQVCREWLSQPDLFPRVLEAERDVARRSLPDTLPDRQAAVEQLERVFTRILVEAKKPTWQRSPVEAPDDNSPGGILISQVVAPLTQVSNSYTHEQAQIRLLACHAAIQRYRWEHDRLPANLTELNLGDLAIDPFTGEPLKYTVRGSRYELTSAGPPAAPDDSQAVDGRKPVSVVPRE
jgi:hypothetical protein